jgi:hypothetical protein
LRSTPFQAKRLLAAVTAEEALSLVLVNSSILYFILHKEHNGRGAEATASSNLINSNTNSILTDNTAGLQFSPTIMVAAAPQARRLMIHPTRMPMSRPCSYIWWIICITHHKYFAGKPLTQVSCFDADGYYGGSLLDLDA